MSIDERLTDPTASAGTIAGYGVGDTMGSQFHTWAGRPRLRFSGAVSVFRRRLPSAASRGIPVQQSKGF